MLNKAFHLVTVIGRGLDPSRIETETTHRLPVELA